MILATFFLFATISGGLVFLIQSRSLSRSILFANILFQVIVTWIAFARLDLVDSYFFRFDSYGIIFSGVLSAILLAVFYHTLKFFERSPASKRIESIYVLSLIFLSASMTGTYFAKHLGILWVCIEASTLSVAALIYHERKGSSLEATWKYIFVCSLGISIAFTGILFISMSANELGVSELDILQLKAIAGKMDPLWLNFAFLLVLTGFSAKMGVFPLQSAAIDAKTVTPYQINALISTALVNAGLTGVFRMFSILSGTPSFVFARKILLIVGLISIAIAAFHLLKVKQFKRMFAFSSLEHMGIVCLALGAGGVGIYAALFHLVLHSFAKSALFFQIGQVRSVYGSYYVHDSGNYLRLNPAGGMVILLSFFTITAIPPSGLFFTEFMIFRSLFQSHFAVTAILALGFLAAIIFALGRNMFHLVYGKTEEDVFSSNIKKRESLSQFVLLALILVLTVNPPDFFLELLSKATLAIGGKPW